MTKKGKGFRQKYTVIEPQKISPKMPIFFNKQNTFTRPTILIYHIEARTFDFHNQPVCPFSEGTEAVWVDVVSPPWEWNAQDDDKKPFLSSVVSSQEAEQ